MKVQWIKSALNLTAMLALALFVGGMLWSLMPFGGTTLPHWMEMTIGLSFNWAAFMVSMLLGVLCVSSLALAYTGQLVKVKERDSHFLPRE